MKTTLKLLAREDDVLRAFVGDNKKPRRVMSENHASIMRHYSRVLLCDQTSSKSGVEEEAWLTKRWSRPRLGGRYVLDRDGDGDVLRMPSVRDWRRVNELLGHSQQFLNLAPSHRRTVAPSSHERMNACSTAFEFTRCERGQESPRSTAEACSLICYPKRRVQTWLAWLSTESHRGGHTDPTAVECTNSR